MADLITVIIPFYQRQSGLLTRALISVAQQNNFDSIEKVIVVDDGSPVSAQTEIDMLSTFRDLQTLIQVFKKPNGGVSSARNAGLDNVKESSRYVALLDADDEWLPEHLELAMQAMQIGSDFHFCNFTHIGQSIGAFERAGYIDPAEHIALKSANNYRYQGNIVQQITTANVIGASSVVYDMRKHPSKRFKTDFTFAGEDYLMWLDITQESDVITFTTKITAHCGEGINLFSGAKWGTTHMSKRLYDEINYRFYLLKNVTMTKGNVLKVVDLLNANRAAYVGNLLSMLKRFKFNALLLLIDHLKNAQFRRVLSRKLKLENLE